MKTELTTEDKQRIEQFITKLGWDNDGTAEFNDMMKVAEYATIYEREQQAKEIDRLTHYLKVAEELNELRHKKIQQLEAERSELRNKVIELEKLIASDSVYTLLRFGAKNPSYSGVDECEEERLYYDLYNISNKLRKIK